MNIVEPKYVILTAFRTPVFQIHLVKSGVSECYEKPIEIETLISILEDS